MQTINFFLLNSLQSEFNLISERITFLSKQYRTVYDMNNDTLLNLIHKYRKSQYELAREILNCQFKDGCNSFNFTPFKTFQKIDTTTNYQM